MPNGFSNRLSFACGLALRPRLSAVDTRWPRKLNLKLDTETESLGVRELLPAVITPSDSSDEALVCRLTYH